MGNCGNWIANHAYLYHFLWTMRKIRSTNIAGNFMDISQQFPTLQSFGVPNPHCGQEPLPITWSAEDDTGQADASFGAGVRVVGHLAMHPGPRKPLEKQRNME